MLDRFHAGMSEQVYQYLTDMILSGEIRPGDAVPENAIATRFHVSRTPVREALRELSKEGILYLSPNRHAEVAIYDEDRVREIGVTKSVLDRLAVRLAVYYGSRAEYEKLRDYANACFQAAKENNKAERIRADSNYHWELCRIGKNRSLMKLEKTLIIQVEYLQAARYLAAEDPKDQYDAHIRVVEALEKGDAAAGMEAITKPGIDFYNLAALPPDLYE
ncbi:MAG: GntR family transcriptional regulator [Lachnospiraceae bacterium]|nr:GntR family transcriptional regulator [Lachnospiraceae bacterium]